MQAEENDENIESYSSYSRSNSSYRRYSRFIYSSSRSSCSSYTYYSSNSSISSQHSPLRVTVNPIPPWASVPCGSIRPDVAMRKEAMMRCVRATEPIDVTMQFARKGGICCM